MFGHRLPTGKARELIEPSEDAESPLVPISKKLFGPENFVGQRDVT